MAEKRVSVRLAAVGGKQVRAELEGVGDAGVRGFGRMSREAELANARLAAFAIQQRGLRPATKIVLWFLCDRHNPDFGCFPTQARLAPQAGPRKSTIEGIQQARRPIYQHLIRAGGPITAVRP